MDAADAILIKKAKRGSLEAFESLLRRYQSKVLHFSKRYVRNEKDAEDITQETFIAIYKNIHKIDPQRPFTTYIFEIAKNKSISHLRKYSKEVSLLDTHVIDEEDAWLNKLDKQNAKQHVATGLKKIPPRYSQVLRLYYFHDFDYNKISLMLKMPLNTVRTLLRRAKIKLKEVLT